jgi:hypothetical protein
MKRLAFLVGLLMITPMAMGAIGDQWYGFDMILNSYQPVTYNGQAAWEYVYDCYIQMDGAGRTTDIYNIYLRDIDPAGILNMYDDGSGPRFYDMWSSVSAGNMIDGWFGPVEAVYAPSYGDLATNNWTYTKPENNYSQESAAFTASNGFINQWHAPSDYIDSEFGLSTWTYIGGEPWDFDGDTTNDGLRFFYGHHGATSWSDTPMLALTMRIVHTDGPAGMVNLRFDNGYGGNKDAGYAIGPAPGYNPGVTGDFDNDGDVDADDIDILMANLGGDPGEFDLTNDGVVDQDDVDEWVFNIVPIGENIGTVYGDFNLDGEVNAGDLALLATNYGLAGTWGWATGDGNGDGNVDAGDLAMLATNYGTVVHPVPEPVTLSLLAVGGAALLRRRSR